MKEAPHRSSMIAWCCAVCTAVSLLAPSYAVSIAELPCRVLRGDSPVPLAERRCLHGECGYANVTLRNNPYGRPGQAVYTLQYCPGATDYEKCADELGKALEDSAPKCDPEEPDKDCRFGQTCIEYSFWLQKWSHLAPPIPMDISSEYYCTDMLGVYAYGGTYMPRGSAPYSWKRKKRAVNILSPEQRALNIPPNQQGALNIPPNQQGALNIPPNQQGALNILPDQPGASNIPPNQPGALDIPPNQQGALDIPPNQHWTADILPYGYMDQTFGNVQGIPSADPSGLNGYGNSAFPPQNQNDQVLHDSQGASNIPPADNANADPSSNFLLPPYIPFYFGLCGESHYQWPPWYTF